MKSKEQLLRIEELMGICNLSWDTLAKSIGQPQWIVDSVKFGKVTNKTTLGVIVEALDALAYRVREKEFVISTENLVNNFHVSNSVSSAAVNSSVDATSAVRSARHCRNKIKHEKKSENNNKTKVIESIAKPVACGHKGVSPVDRSLKGGTMLVVRCSKDTRPVEQKPSEQNLLMGKAIQSRRLAMRLSIGEMAGFLNIKVGVLEALENGAYPSYMYYKEINNKLIVGDFNRIKVSTNSLSEGFMRRPRGSDSQHTRKPWTRVLIKRK